MSWLRQWAARLGRAIVPGRHAAGAESEAPPERPRHPELFETAEEEEEAAFNLVQYIEDDLFVALPSSIKVRGNENFRVTELELRSKPTVRSKYLVEGQGAASRWRIVVCSEEFGSEEKNWFETIEGDFADFRDLLQPDTDHH